MRRLQTFACCVTAIGIFAVSLQAADGPRQTPQQVAGTWFLAKTGGDAKVELSLLTQPSQSLYAGEVCLFAGFCAKPLDLFGRRTPTAKEQKRLDAFRDVLKRHGISLDDIESARDSEKKGEKKSRADELELEFRRTLALGERIKDKQAFVTEVMELLRTEFDKELPERDPAPPLEAVVKELRVKMNADQSRATVSFADGSSVAELQLENGVWKIDLVEVERQKLAAKSKPERASSLWWELLKLPFGSGW